MALETKFLKMSGTERFEDGQQLNDSLFPNPRLYCYVVWALFKEQATSNVTVREELQKERWFQY